MHAQRLGLAGGAHLPAAVLEVADDRTGDRRQGERVAWRAIATVACARSASTAILAFSATSIFDLALFVIFPLHLQ